MLLYEEQGCWLKISMALALAPDLKLQTIINQCLHVVSNTFRTHHFTTMGNMEMTWLEQKGKNKKFKFYRRCT